MTKKTRYTLSITVIIITLLTIFFSIGGPGFAKAHYHYAQQWFSAHTSSHELTELIKGSAGSLEEVTSLDKIPEYKGDPYVVLNNNEPLFTGAAASNRTPGYLANNFFEDYGMLDSHGRCTTATANLSIDTQPSPGETRGDISSIHPTGWHSGMGWERCHLIGWQLCGENANRNNLVTGTHYMNVSGMLPFENRVDWYLSETGNHVLYEVTPVFKGNNTICSGVQMQARSVEDNGAGISFNVFCFNVSPGKEIDYKTGVVTTTDEDLAAEHQFGRTYVLNTNSMKFHYPSCSSVSLMADHNKQVVTDNREHLIKIGYDPCGNCGP